MVIGIKVHVMTLNLFLLSEPEPESVTCVVELFRDDFDGADLKAHWEVINPDPDT